MYSLFTDNTFIFPSNFRMFGFRKKKYEKVLSCQETEQKNLASFW